MDSTYILKMYNIPLSKTEKLLKLELSKVPVEFKKIILARKSLTESAGYANIYFNNESDLNEFASYYQKLRRDLVIYREL